MIFGTYNGRIYLFDFQKLLNDDSVCSFDAIQPDCLLQGHCSTVYSLFTMKTDWNEDGTTSIFPTFIGRSARELGSDIIVSIGYGTSYPNFEEPFSSSVQKKGACLNVWLV